MSLRVFPALPLALLLAAPGAVHAQQTDIATAYRVAADSLIRGATADSAAYRRLGRLVDSFGHRLSGSASLEAAIDWILDFMKADSLENVHGEPVMVPHWVRGAESADGLAAMGVSGEDNFLECERPDDVEQVIVALAL